jgi:RNA polymerase sigma factor (sigma-70 family)
METVKRKPRAHGAIVKGHTIPYGTLVGASAELHKAYYYHGYKEDWMLPEIPCPPYEDRECHSPEEELFKKELVERVEEVLNTLTPRAKKVVCLRYGIGLTNDYTLEEIGTRFDVTRERIRQIEMKAVRDLKHPARSIKFREMLGQWLTSDKRAGKELESQAAQVQWAKERNAAQQREEARAQFKVTARQREKQREQELEEMYKEDLRLREKWEDIKPMVSDTAWVEHLKTENPEMYQELRNVVTYIWGYNADKVWEMFAEKEKGK